MFFDLTTGQQARRGGGSLSNVPEAQLALNVYLTLKRAFGQGQGGDERGVVGRVGVISPYAQQVKELRARFQVKHCGRPRTFYRAPCGDLKLVLDAEVGVIGSCNIGSSQVTPFSPPNWNRDILFDLPFCLDINIPLHTAFDIAGTLRCSVGAVIRYSWSLLRVVESLLRVPK